MGQTKNKGTVVTHKFIALLLSFALLSMSALALTACGGSAMEDKPEEPATSTPEPTATAVKLQIFAANSLEKALPEVQALYTEQNPHITFSDTQFKGSGDLVTELQGGAPADLLITASGATMETAIENGSIDESTREDMFKNDLVIVRQEGSDVEISSLEDVNGENITKVAIGDSDAVPAGAYANQSLATIGLYSDESGKGGTYLESFASKVINESSVGNVAKVVSTGDAQIGFVYTSDLYRYDGIEEAFVVPGGTHKNIVYPGAVVAASKEADEAQKFLDFCLNDPDAQKIWSKYGFEVA